MSDRHDSNETKNADGARPAGAPVGAPVGASVDPDEIARFEALADAWWDPDGPFRPLHKFNPVRLGFIRDRIATHFGRVIIDTSPFAGLSLLDIGCGGGLVAEPMARLGASVTGIDAAPRNIAIAQHHAAESGLAIDYRAITAEDLAATGTRFDIVLSLEIVEHVADLDSFLGACCTLAKPDGLMIVATLNRTAKAFALAVVGAEYVLRWLPRGTHNWRKFVRPSELSRGLALHGAKIEQLAGVAYNPLTDRWRIGTDLDVNYMAVVRPAAARDAA
ncbi:MAG: bifunctional 2-polyprenyl-6-hydroxyphenol methylase/3-demethylubiquinol 3-O-methyltransferase UbiG [Dongiaceae bacterium]